MIEDSGADRPRATDARGEPISLGEFGGFEVYPMPFFATLECEDVTSTVAWYRDALGFGVMFTGPEIAGQPSLVHLRRRKYQDLLLRPSTKPTAIVDPPPPPRL